MAIPLEYLNTGSEEPRPHPRLRAAPAERARILSAVEPFDLEAWRRETPPATAEELAGIDEFLESREADWKHRLAAELECLQTAAE